MSLVAVLFSSLVRPALSSKHIVAVILWLLIIFLSFQPLASAWNLQEWRSAKQVKWITYKRNFWLELIRLRHLCGDALLPWNAQLNSSFAKWIKNFCQINTVVARFATAFVFQYDVLYGVYGPNTISSHYCFERMGRTGTSQQTDQVCHCIST